MSDNVLEVAEGIQYQTADEELAYSVTTTNWVSTPTTPVVKAYDTTLDDSDVTTTVFPTNSPSVATDTITLSPLKALTKGHSYRVEVKFTVGSNIYECFFKVKCVK